jgi:cytochrome c-type biogenesis protein CcmH
MKYIYSFCILLSCYTFSAIVFEFDNEADESRFNNLIKEIRCPKCTSGSLYSSNAPVSEDLKKRIAEMINQGKSNTFGKESLYDPQFQQDTFLLWFGPVIFVFVAFILFFLRRKT